MADDEALLERLRSQVAALEAEQRRWRTTGLLTLVLLLLAFCGGSVVLVGVGIISYRSALVQRERMERVRYEAAVAREQAEQQEQAAERARALLEEQGRKR